MDTWWWAIYTLLIPAIDTSHSLGRWQVLSMTLVNQNGRVNNKSWIYAKTVWEVVEENILEKISAWQSCKTKFWGNGCKEKSAFPSFAAHGKQVSAPGQCRQLIYQSVLGHLCHLVIHSFWQSVGYNTEMSSYSWEPSTPFRPQFPLTQNLLYWVN